MSHKNNPTDLLAAFSAFLQEQKLLQDASTTLLAVSGGLDSIVMASLFVHAKLPFAIAHCNFGLRGMASQQDEEWVCHLANLYQVPYYTQKFNTLAYAQQNKLSIQMAARQLRYQWFEALCDKHQLAQFATAHHSNDSLETLLLNLVKGTGIAGLHGILPRKGRLIRPLLFANKATLLHYAQRKNLTWREDASNAQDAYARNLIRNQVMPILKLVNPNIDNTSRLTIERLHQVEIIFQEQVATIQQKIVYSNGQVYEIDFAMIQHKPWAPVIMWELLKPFGFSFSQIKTLFSQKLQSGKKLYNPRYQLYVDRAKWMIMPTLEQNKLVYSIPNQGLKTIAIKGHTLQISIVARKLYTITPDNQIAALDLALLQFPLQIRNWQPGDFFYSLGMQKSKKISDFLVDLKIPVPYKEQICVLVSGKAIVWVIGYRLDDRFKLQNTTQEVYQLRLVPNVSAHTVITGT